MKIILKHIFKNIWKKKGRSLLIILALIIATAVFVLNLTLPNEIVLKINETMNSVFGDTDITVSTIEPFLFDELNVGDEKIDSIGISELQITLQDKQALIFGVDIKQAKKMKLLGNDVSNLNNNEIIISNKLAEQYNYKNGDIITFSVDDRQHELKIVRIVSKVGLTALETGTPLFISNLNTINAIKNIADRKYDIFYIDVKNNENINSYTEYLQENNENYLIEKRPNIDEIKNQISMISSIMIMIFVMATIMIFFIISSLNKIILAERMPIIGTFRSVGATKGKMNFILILENAMYGLIGGIIGCVLGYVINSEVASLFISSNGVGITKQTTPMSFSTILIGIVFAILLEIIISMKSIIQANKKSIKEIIFDVQETRYIIRRIGVIAGILLIILSLTIDYFNSNMKILPSIIAIIFLIVGFATLVPVIIGIISAILVKFAKRISWATGIIASKNIAYNKMVISSSRLIIVALSLVIAILTVSSSVSNLFNSVRYVIDDYDIIIQGLGKTSKEYNELLNMHEIEDIEYRYFYQDSYTTFNNGKEFNVLPVILGENESRIDIKEFDYKIKDLKYNEILIDEKFAESNKIKINDLLKIKLETLNKEFDYKVVGFVNSAYFTTARNVIIMNLENYLENIIDIPNQIYLEINDKIDLQDFKEKINNELKEIGIKIQTFDEFVTEQEESTNSIMSLFYIVVGLTVILSFIGILNNQIIGFMERKKELAVLNSTCMSKKQIKKMLITENILANGISCLMSIIVGILAINIIKSFMQGLTLYVEILFDWNLVLKFVGIIFIILLLTLRIPLKRLRKMNIVNEIKYE